MRSFDHDPSPTRPPETAASTVMQPVSQRRRRNAMHRFEALVQLAPDATFVVDRSGHIQLVNRQAEQLFGYPAQELLGQPIELVIPEHLRDLHQPSREGYAAAPRVRPMGANLPLSGRRRDGSEFPIEASLGPLDQGGESLVIVSIHDISELQQVHDAHVATQAANQELRALQALTDTALSHLSLEDLVPALLERVADVLDVDNAAVLLLDPSGQTLTVQAAYRVDESASSEVRVPVGHGIAGCIAATREPLVVDDIATFSSAPPLFREAVRSVAGVPLVLGDQLLGVVLVATASSRHFTTRDVQMLQQVADRMAIAIDRARLYARAQESEYRYRRLVEANIIGIAVTDTEHVLEANDAFLRLLGYTQEDVQAGRLSRDTLATPDTRVLSERTAQEAVETGASMPFEREYLHKDSSRVPVLVGPVLLQREPVRVVNFVVDLTGQKRLERERTEQAEQLNRIFEGIADGLVVYNAQGQPVRLNAAARRILGLDVAPAAYANLPASDRAVLYEARDERGNLLAPEDWPLIRVLSGQVTEADTREVRLRMLDGHDVEVITSAAPLRDREGHLLGAVTILHDQTDQKRLAREQEQARAHELILENTTRHMDEFLATASHDLRTPLTVVKSRMQLALRRFTRLQERAACSPDVLPDAEIEAVSASLLEASHSTDRLVRLVTLLFDVAQARSGMLELKLAPCDLAALVHRTVSSQQVAVAKRRIVVKVPAKAVLVEADADRLDQVLSNFLSNALKYSPADQPVTARLEVVDKLAVVSVTDHGPGLPPEEQSRIWEVFHRVPGVEVQFGNGESSGSLGLGLHICKQLVELHPGGSVGVESTVGEGSTFWFRLPLAS